MLDSDPPVDPFDRHGPTPELPDLDSGIVLLSTDDRTTAALHSLVVDRLLRAAGPAPWVDAGGHARTRRLARVAPSGRTLDRIRVARGFTAFQHLAIVETLGDRLLGASGDGETPAGEGSPDPPVPHGGSPDPADDESDPAGDESDPAGSEKDPAGDSTTAGGESDPALVVAPAVDAPYRDDDLRAGEAREMLLRALAVLAGVARRRDCPVLVTRAGDDGFAAPVAAAAAGRIRCESTPEGPRFVGGDFETLVYPVDGEWVQTTLAFWERVLAARAPDGVAGPASGPALAGSAGTGDRAPAGSRSGDGSAPAGSGGSDDAAAPRGSGVGGTGEVIPRGAH